MIRRSSALTACLLLFVATAVAAADVSIVVGESSPAYLEAAQAVSRELASPATTMVMTAEEFERSPRRAAALVVALGTRALHAVIANGSGTPVIATLIPRSTYELELASLSRPSGPKAITAVFLDQPIARQLNLLRLVVPERARVGLLTSTATDQMARRIDSAARERGLSVVRASVTDSQGIPGALTRLLGESEVLLALPDPAIFNASTIHNILFSALRAQQPMIGFSDAYVRAGALAAVFSKPQQVGRQAGGIAARAISGAPLPPPQYPREFSVSVNPTVARTLGLTIDEERIIVAKLQRMEREP